MMATLALNELIRSGILYSLLRTGIFLTHHNKNSTQRTYFNSFTAADYKNLKNLKFYNHAHMNKAQTGKSFFSN